MHSSSNPTNDHLLTCLGGPWPEPLPLDLVTHEQVQEDGYWRLRVSYAVATGERVPAFVLVPDGVDAAHPAPGVVVWHQHNDEWHLGKSEPAGLAGNPEHHTGVALVREGYVVLCADTLCFEERRDDRLEGLRYEEFESLRHLTQGTSLAWRNIIDARAGVDALASLPQVDAERLGAYGHSMGATIGWLTGPWEPRLTVIVGNCCLPTYAAIQEQHLTHCHTTFVPGWQRYGDTPDIAALVAPTALHLNFGADDGGSPIDAVRAGIDVIAQEYARQGVAERFTSFIEPDVGHRLTAAMWLRTRAVFARYLHT
ncbi:MAG: dienelactone hydrolase family protein [Demequina sp.]